MARKWNAGEYGSEYDARTGRSWRDDARLGWALATREFMRAHLVRGFVGLQRVVSGGRRLEPFEELPHWFTTGVVVLRPAFEAYANVDPGWRLLVDHPELKDVHRILEHPDLARELLASADPEMRLRVTLGRANAEFEKKVADRRRDDEARELCHGVRARFSLVSDEPLSFDTREPTASELNLLAAQIGIEPFTSIDPARRRWVERLRSWPPIDEARRQHLQMLALYDAGLDGKVPLDGVPDRSGTPSP